jgi:hypothetical protein
MKIELDIFNDNDIQYLKLGHFMRSSLGESRLENAIHEFLIENGFDNNDVVINVADRDEREMEVLKYDIK